MNESSINAEYHPTPQDEFVAKLIDKISERNKKATWSDKLRITGTYLGIVLVVASVVQQINITYQNWNINEQLQDRGAYMNVGLRNSAEKGLRNFVKASETEKQERRKLERFQDYCRGRCFDLAPDLMISIVEPVYEVVESPERFLIEQGQSLSKDD